MRKRCPINQKIIIIAIAITALVAAAAFFGAKALYSKGVSDGEAMMSEKLSENITNLAAAVSEKVAISQKITDSLSNLPQEVDADAIAEHLNAINELKNSVENEKISALLDSYRSEWEKFEQVYATEDNNAISESFQNLEKFSAEISAEIKSVLDENITSALDLLK